jgi:hypothetical protein
VCSSDLEFCYNGGDLITLEMPIINKNYVQILDAAFLSIPNILDLINYLGSLKVNKKVIYYELVQGINYKDLTLEIAKALKKNIFIKIRFAWDRKYNKDYMFKIYDTINLLKKAGYKPKELTCFMLVNWLVSYEDCLKKLDLLKYWGVKVADCCYNGGYHIKKYSDYMANQMPKNWSYEKLKKFRSLCRLHNIIIPRGIDPLIK